MKTTLLTAACSLAILAGCTSGKVTTSSYSGAFTGKLSEGSSNTVSLNINAEYPESGFSAEGMKDVTCRIKKAVLGEKYAGLDIEDGADMYFDDLLKEYRETNVPLAEEFYSETGEIPASLDWQYDIDGHFTGQYRNMVSYAVRKYSYTGGAHGMTTTTAYTFDSKSGKIMTEGDIFADGYTEKLSAMLTAHASDGYGNPDDLVLFVDKIEPNGNFSVGADGITYIYNPYDVAPYSSGTVNITVPWRELRAIMR
ncbi:MAG: DUF3298 and DUF4163 domain-containing protein [Clostridium sp.]|nr:DUF3298 and DUF4163 domain-containing protein [Bacteroides sp.]MCM1198791.1 DUF3298 and DUF4163 domain-containing protein [Clostridium sp.]